MPNQEQSRDGTQRKDQKSQERPSAGEQLDGGGGLDFEDGDMAHPYGKTTSAGRTRDEKFPSDAGDLGSPNVGMSDRNGPSDPDAKRSK